MPLMHQYKYYWRLDTDSFILNEINYDLFDYMDEHGLYYATIALSHDDADVTAGMREMIADYIEKHPTMASINNYKPSLEMVYNNFEIVNIAKFRSPEVWNFVEHFDRSNKILTRRWGDAPLRFAELKLFFNWERHVKILCGIRYEHSHHHRIIERLCPEDTIAPRPVLVLLDHVEPWVIMVVAVVAVPVLIGLFILVKRAVNKLTGSSKVN